MTDSKASNSHNKTHSNEIPSSEQSRHKLPIFIGCIFFLFSIPLFEVIPKEINQDNYNILYLLIFPLIGYIMTSGGWKLRKKYYAIGPMPLTLSPEIGQVGGEIGGAITLIKPYKANDIQITLSCLHRYSTIDKNRSTSDKKHVTTHNDIFWESVQQATYTQQQKDILEFCFDVPGDIPTQERHTGKGEIHWLIQARGQLDELIINRSWEIPVEHGSEKSEIKINLNNTGNQKVSNKAPEEANIETQINIQEKPNELYLISEPGRNGRNNLMIFLMGVFIGSINLMMFSWALSDGGIIWIFALFLLPFAPFVWLKSLFLMSRKLESKIIEDKVYIRRSIWGRTLYTLEGKLTSTEQIETTSIERISSSSTGATIDLIDIIAILNIEGLNKKVALAEGIQGEKAATQLKQLIIKTIIQSNKSLHGELDVF